MKKLVSFLLVLISFCVLFFTEYSPVSLVSKFIEYRSINNTSLNCTKKFNEKKQEYSISFNKVNSMLNTSKDFCFDFLSNYHYIRCDLVDQYGDVIQENINKSTPNIDLLKFTFKTSNPENIIKVLKSNHLVVMGMEYDTRGNIFSCILYCKSGGN